MKREFYGEASLEPVTMSSPKNYKSTEKLIPVKRQLFHNAALRFGLYPDCAEFYHLVDMDIWCAINVRNLRDDAYEEINDVAIVRRKVKANL
jgi:hypothetical protein